MHRYAKRSFVQAAENKTEKPYNYVCWKINEGYLTKSFWLLCVFPVSSPPLSPSLSLSLASVLCFVLVILVTWLLPASLAIRALCSHCAIISAIKRCDGRRSRTTATKGSKWRMKKEENNKTHVNSQHNKNRLFFSSSPLVRRCKKHIFNDCSNLHRNPRNIIVFWCRVQHMLQYMYPSI